MLLVSLETGVSLAGEEVSGPPAGRPPIGPAESPAAAAPGSPSSTGGKPLLLGSPPAVQLAVRLVEIAMQRLALVLGHALAPLVGTVLPHVAPPLVTLGTRTGGPFLRLHAQEPAGGFPAGCGRTREKSGSERNSDESAFHPSMYPASGTPVGVTIVIIVRVAQLSGLGSPFISSSPLHDQDRLQRKGM